MTAIDREDQQQKAAWSVARLLCPPTVGEVTAARLEGDTLHYTARIHQPIQQVTMTLKLAQDDNNEGNQG